MDRVQPKSDAARRSSMKAVLGLAVLVGGLLTGCGCTQAGCESQVIFHLTADLRNGVAYDVEACLDDDCSTATIEVPVVGGDEPFTGLEEGGILLLTDSDEIHLTLPEGDYGGAHRVSLDVRTSDGDVVVTVDEQTDFERYRPNGPLCEPVCWLAEVMV